MDPYKSPYIQLSNIMVCMFFSVPEILKPKMGMEKYLLAKASNRNTKRNTGYPHTPNPKLLTPEFNITINLKPHKP